MPWLLLGFLDFNVLFPCSINCESTWVCLCVPVLCLDACLRLASLPTITFFFLSKPSNTFCMARLQVWRLGHGLQAQQRRLPGVFGLQAAALVVLGRCGGLLHRCPPAKGGLRVFKPPCPDWCPFLPPLFTNKKRGFGGGVPLSLFVDGFLLRITLSLS